MGFYYCNSIQSYWAFLFLLGTSSPIVWSPTKMWCDSLKSLRKMGEYMSSSFLTSWMKEDPEPAAPYKTVQRREWQSWVKVNPRRKTYYTYTYLKLCIWFHTQGYHRVPMQIPNVSHHWLKEYSIFTETWILNKRFSNNVYYVTSVTLTFVKSDAFSLLTCNATNLFLTLVVKFFAFMLLKFTGL